MRFLLAICSLVLFFTALACGGSDSGKSSSSSDKIALGKKIYKTRCVLCHGINGKLGANGSKDITASALTKAERVALIKNGKGAMTAFGDILSAEEIEAVASYSFRIQ